MEVLNIYLYFRNYNSISIGLNVHKKGKIKLELKREKLLKVRPTKKAWTRIHETSSDTGS